MGFNTFYWVFLVGFHQDSIVFSIYLTLILRQRRKLVSLCMFQDLDAKRRPKQQIWHIQVKTSKSPFVRNRRRRRLGAQWATIRADRFCPAVQLRPYSLRRLRLVKVDNFREEKESENRTQQPLFNLEGREKRSGEEGEDVLQLTPRVFTLLIITPP